MSDEKNINEQQPGIENDETLKGQTSREQAQEETPKGKEEPSKNREEKKDHKKAKKDKPTDYIEHLEKELQHTEKLGKELEELKDRHIRLQAEFDNFRKRTLKEKMELMKSGGESVLTNILPVIDDFERALATLEREADNHIKTGVVLIYNKFQEFLKNNGVKEIEAKEKDFDTDLHEAVTKIPAPTKELKGKIVDVIQKGYLLNDKVIRFAKVVIGE